MGEPAGELSKDLRATLFQFETFKWSSHHQLGQSKFNLVNSLFPRSRANLKTWDPLVAKCARENHFQLNETLLIKSNDDPRLFSLFLLTNKFKWFQIVFSRESFSTLKGKLRICSVFPKERFFQKNRFSTKFASVCSWSDCKIYKSHTHSVGKLIIQNWQFRVPKSWSLCFL